MSRILDTFPAYRQDRHKPNPWLYPWDRYLDGQIHALTLGVHFKSSPELLRSAAHAAARRAGIKVRTVWVPESQEFVIQALHPERVKCDDCGTVEDEHRDVNGGLCLALRP